MGYNDFINGHIKYMCQYDDVVNRRQSVSSHPFEDRLRCAESEYRLYISNLEPFVFDQSSDVRAGCDRIDRRRCCAHKKKHLSV